MRRHKTPEALKQWRKDNSGLTHIGQYKAAGLHRIRVGGEAVWAVNTGAADYDEVTRNEFLHKDHA